MIRFPPETSAQRVLADERLSLISPSVAALRTELFDAEEEPFRSIEEARAWLEQHRPRDRLPPRRVAELQRQLRELVSDFERLSGSRCHISVRNPTVQLPREGNADVSTVRVTAGSPAARLAEVVERLAEATGFTEHDLIGYVLWGRPIDLPIVLGKRLHSSVDLAGEGSVHRYAVVLEINAKYLTSKQQHRLWSAVADCWGEIVPDRLNETERALLDIVLELIRERNGPPEKPWGREFWQEVLQRSQQQGIVDSRGNPYSDWRAPMMRVRELTKKNVQVEQLLPFPQS